MRYLLNTYPRSGTHYFKALLSDAIGQLPLEKRLSIAKESDFKPNYDLAKALQDDAPERLIYDHFRFDVDGSIIDQNNYPDCRIILLNRHPLDRLISSIAFKKMHKDLAPWCREYTPEQLARDFLLGLHDGRRCFAQFKTRSFAEFHKHDIRVSMVDWLTHRNCHYIKFEDLIRKPIKTFISACAYFDISLSAYRARQILSDNRFEMLSGGRHRGEVDPNSHYRSGVIGQWKVCFSRNDLRRIRAQYGDDYAAMDYRI